MSTSPYPLYIIGAFGGILLLSGLRSLLTPHPAINTFGFPIKPTDTTALDMVRLRGASNLALGSSLILLTFFGERRGTGLMSAAVTGLGFLDAYLIWTRGMRSHVGGHLGGTVVLGGLAWLLLA